MATQTPDAAKATMIANLPERTGKSLPEWLALLGATSLEKHGEILKLLKGEHGVTHGFANLIAHEFRNRRAGDEPPDLVGAQYKGAKAGLKPIYDAIVAQCESFGSDVELAPKKNYVSLRSRKQFALIQPSTKTRVDVGINLKDAPASDRLEASGSFNAMVSHRVRLESVSDVDEELGRWLKAAYEQSRGSAT
jgi:predicted transport protein